MANFYVYSGGSNTAPYDTWAKAATALGTAIGACAAGDSVYVAHDQAESIAAATTYTIPGTIGSPVKVICVNRAGSVPPVSADLAVTGSIATTGANALTLTGCAYIYGLIFSAGSGANAVDLTLGGTTQTDLRFRKCAIRLGGTNGGRVMIGSATAGVGSRVTWSDTTYQVAGAGATLNLNWGVSFSWKGTASAITGATIPTTLFGANTAGAGVAHLDGVDLGALSSKTFVAALARHGDYYLKDCTLPASWTLNAAPTSAAPNIYIIRSDSTSTTHKLEKHNAFGDQTAETSIVRTGGAGVNGTQVAMKLVSSANASWASPFESTPLAVANSTTGTNRTVTVYGIWGGGAVPNNDDIWIEVGYLGTSGSPLASFASTTKADILAANAATATDTSTWGGSTTKFKMVATLNSPQPALGGDMYVVVKVGAASSTFYIDPLVVLG